jgi:hypothetical protein
MPSVFLYKERQKREASKAVVEDDNNYHVVNLLPSIIIPITITISFI